MRSIAEYVIIDVETTGLDPESDKIVEIAAIRYRGKQHIDEWQSLINPDIPIPASASAVHHITDKDVHDAPRLDEIWPSLREFCAGRILVAHNAEFDSAFLKGIDARRWLCSYRFARHLWPELLSHTNQYLRYHLNVDIPFAGVHRALADVAVTAGVFMNELETYRSLGNEWSVGAIAGYIAQPVPIPRMPFGKHRGQLLTDVPSDYIRWAVNGGITDADVLHALGKEQHRRMQAA